jgi:hypothetical protein
VLTNHRSPHLRLTSYKRRISLSSRGRNAMRSSPGTPPLIAELGTDKTFLMLRLTWGGSSGPRYEVGNARTISALSASTSVGLKGVHRFLHRRPLEERWNPIHHPRTARPCREPQLNQARLECGSWRAVRQADQHGSNEQKRESSHTRRAHPPGANLKVMDELTPQTGPHLRARNGQPLDLGRVQVAGQELFNSSLDNE